MNRFDCKDRNIYESTSIIQDMLDYIENSNDEEILFTIDIGKAFDSVDHNFLSAVLKKIGFKQTFIAWMKILLNRTEACIMKNGWSAGFLNSREERDKVILYQRLVLEIVFFQIRQSDTVKGFKVEWFRN